MECNVKASPASADEKTPLQMYHVTQSREAIEIVPMRYRKFGSLLQSESLLYTTLIQVTC